MTHEELKTLVESAGLKIDAADREYVEIGTGAKREVLDALVVILKHRGVQATVVQHLGGGNLVFTRRLK